MDILKRIDWHSINIDCVSDLALDKKALEDSEYVLALAEDKEQLIKTRTAIKSLATWRVDTVFMTRQLIDIVPNPWIAHELCCKVAKNLINKYGEKIVGYNLAFVIEELRKQIVRERDRLAESIFRKLATDKVLWFFLIYDKGGYRLPTRIRIKNDTKRLVRADNSQLERSLFEEVPEEGINQLEKSVAICLDEQQKLLWWYRNLSRQDYFVQGWKKNRIYPDFLFTKVSDKDPNDYSKVFVIETKGLHLMNEDTAYKASVFDFCNHLGQQKDWRELNLEFDHKGIEFQVISEAEWRNKINKILS
jgi:type III restriction enzyme